MHEIFCQERDEIRIGDSVRVAVLEVAEDFVRLRVESPDQFPTVQELIVHAANFHIPESETEQAVFDRALVVN